MLIKLGLGVAFVSYVYNHHFLIWIIQSHLFFIFIAITIIKKENITIIIYYITRINFWVSIVSQSLTYVFCIYVLLA